MIQIRNNQIVADISRNGASLERLVVDGKSVLWNGDDTWWNRSAPFLFPIVGRLIDNEYLYEGKTYSLAQHGFLRDSMFQVQNQSESSCTLKFSSNEETKRVYPFDFEVLISYACVGKTVLVDATVTNTGEKEMIYSFGYHPAFVFESDDAYIELQGPRPFKEYLFDGPYCTGTTEYNELRVEMDKMTYENSTLVYEEVHRVVLHDGERQVAMDVRSYPQLGIWRPIHEDGAGAPFVCLEPWCGFGDWVHHNKELEQRFGTGRLSPGSQRNWSTTLEF